MLEEYKQNDYFFIKAYYIDLIATNWRNWKIKLTRNIVTIAIAMSVAIADLYIDLKKTIIS